MLEQRPGPDFIVFSNHYFRGYPRRQNVNDSNSDCCQLSIFYTKLIDAALTKLYDICSKWSNQSSNPIVLNYIDYVGVKDVYQCVAII